MSSDHHSPAWRQEAVPNGNIILYHHGEVFQPGVPFLRFSHDVATGALEVEGLPIKGQVVSTSMCYACAGGHRVAAKDAILQAALFMCAAADQRTLNDPVGCAPAPFLAGYINIELCPLAVVPALVHTATFLSWDATVPAQDEAGITETPFSARSITHLQGHEPVASGWATVPTELIVRVGGAGEVWKKRWERTGWFRHRKTYTSHQKAGNSFFPYPL